jgi:immune inhibitor A
LYHSVNSDPQIWKSRRWVVGCWELMGGGSGWGCGTGAPTNPGTTMALLGAWTRTRVGWAEPFVAPIDRDSVYTLHPPATGGSVLRVPVSATEYFLVEYRQQTIVDDAPPATGVLIYHVDEALPMFPALTAPRRYRVQLVEADDGSQLTRIEDEGGDRGSASDAFGISRMQFGTGNHSAAVTTAGAALPFAIREITLKSNQTATVRIGPP